MLDDKRLQESFRGTRHLTEADPPATTRMNSSFRSTINRDLDRRLKNQFFQSVAAGLNVITQVLNSHGFEEAEPFMADKFNKTSGHETFRLAQKTDNPFAPIEVTNSMIVIQYGKAGDNDRFEVLAYLS